MKYRNDLTAEYIRSVINYDPETGDVWRKGRKVSTTRPEGYLVINVNDRIYRLSRIIWLWMTGEWPKNDVDHIDLDKGNNRWANLRDSTFTQNMQNRPRRSINKSGFKGVCWDKKAGKWHAQIGYGGTQHHIGYFNRPESASKAYSDAATKHHGQFARTT